MYKMDPILGVGLAVLHIKGLVWASRKSHTLKIQMWLQDHKNGREPSLIGVSMSYKFQK